jgi:hypothetical protein
MTTGRGSNHFADALLDGRIDERIVQVFWLGRFRVMNDDIRSANSGSPRPNGQGRPGTRQYCPEKKYVAVLLAHGAWLDIDDCLPNALDRRTDPAS